MNPAYLVGSPHKVTGLRRPKKIVFRYLACPSKFERQRWQYKTQTSKLNRAFQILNRLWKKLLTNKSTLHNLLDSTIVQSMQIPNYYKIVFVMMMSLHFFLIESGTCLIDLFILNYILNKNFAEPIRSFILQKLVNFPKPKFTYLRHHVRKRNQKIITK